MHTAKDRPYDPRVSPSTQLLEQGRAETDSPIPNSVRREDSDSSWTEIQSFVQGKLRLPILHSLNGVSLIPMRHHRDNTSNIELIAHFGTFQQPVIDLDMELIQAQERVCYHCCVISNHLFLLTSLKFHVLRVGF